VPKHRKPEGEPWLAPVGAHAPAGNGYRASKGYDGGAVEPGWAAAPEGHYRQERQDWRDWGPPPALPPDHPSAPMPRVEFPADQPLRRVPAPRIPAPRSPVAPAGYQRQTDPPWPETTSYGDESGSQEPGPGPATRRLPNGRFPGRNSVGAPWQVPTPADGYGPPNAQEAQDYAAAIREAAEREAAAITRDATNRADAITQRATDQATAIREAAERDAAELRARLASMSGELGRVAAYVTQNLSTPPRSVPSPAEVTAAPAAKAAATTPRPAPTRKPPTSATTTRPGPARQTGAKPAGRQAKVMRRMVVAIAAVSAIGAIAGTSELALHGVPFFILRANGAGAGETGPKEPVNPEMPKQAGEVHCSVLHLACTLSTPSADNQPGAHHQSATPQPSTSKK
jgi:hypothetical protein